MTGPNAMKLGDVLHARSGKTIEFITPMPKVFLFG